MTKKMMRRMCVVAGLLVGSVSAQAFAYDAQIMIDRALNSPTLTVRYKGAHAALVELRVNGESLGTRSVTASKDAGETNFNLNLSELKDGDNEVEIRLFDRTGKLVGSDHTNISTEQSLNAPVYLTAPKVGQTVRGPVDIKLGFGESMKEVYVSFFVDNSFKSMSNIPPYQYSWDSTTEPNGWHELEAWAIDGTSTTFKTRKVKVFVNNPGGRTNRPGVTDDTATPSLNPNQVGLQDTTVHTNIRATQGWGAAASGNAASGVAPAIRGGSASHNSLRAEIVDSTMGEKPISAPRGMSTGVRQLLPTGTRVAQTSYVPVASSHVHHTIIQSLTPMQARISIQAVGGDSSMKSMQLVGPIASVRSSQGVQPLLPSPRVSTTRTIKPVQMVASHTVNPLKRVNNPDLGEISIVRHVDVALAPMTQRLSAVPSASVYGSVAATTSMIQITRGQRIPNLGSFAVILNSQYMDFDVPTRVDGGVPMAPFRHLIEKSGGSVNWENTTKTVNAQADGHSILLQIGDKNARINNSLVPLDLAPYIDKGRTIVPISFMRSALNVNVEYDKTTGHVLITSTKN